MDCNQGKWHCVPRCRPLLYPCAHPPTSQRRNIKLLENELDQLGELQRLPSTAVPFAQARRFRDGVQLLVAAGADIHGELLQKDNVSRTAVHIACYQKDWVSVAFLVSHGADVYYAVHGAIGCPCCVSGSVLDYLFWYTPMAGLRAVLEHLPEPLDLTACDAVSNVLTVGDVDAVQMLCKYSSADALREFVAFERQRCAQRGFGFHSPLESALFSTIGNEQRLVVFEALLSKDAWSMADVESVLALERKGAKLGDIFGDEKSDPNPDQLCNNAEAHGSFCALLEQHVAKLRCVHIANISFGLAALSLPVLVTLAIAGVESPTLKDWKVAALVHTAQPRRP